jgi:hypothetical protein
MQQDSELPINIQQRYGLNTRSKTPVALAVILASIVTIGLGMANYRSGDRALDWELRSFSVQSANSVEVVWEVARNKDQDTYCVIRAQDDKRMDVGYATVFVAAGEPNVTANYNLATESLAVLVEVLGCAGKPEMRVPPADFPPGVKIPAQAPPGFAPEAN